MMAFVVAMAGMMFPAYSMEWMKGHFRIERRSGRGGAEGPLTWKRVWLSMSNAEARRFAAATTKSSVSSSSLSKERGMARSILLDNRSTLGAAKRQLRQRLAECETTYLETKSANESVKLRGRWSLIPVLPAADVSAACAPDARDSSSSV